MAERILKRCEKCGRTSLCRPRQRRCRRTDTADKGFRHQYLCYGQLVAVERTKQKPAKSQQVIAQEKLGHAEQMVAAKTSAMKRLVTALGFWQRRAAYYAKQAMLTDEERAAARTVRLASEAQRRSDRARRGIKVGGEKP